MKCHCPHCHNPIELVEQDALEELVCPSCGSNISLVSSPTLTFKPEAGCIGHFELLQQVGVGAFGSVWRARDTKLDRIVALKIPRREALDAAQADQFFREARAAAQTKHANIVGIHEIGRDGDRLFIASEFVDGANLAEWVSANPMTFRESAKLCATIAEALHAAHERGVVHRDLKPGNIMLDGDAKPYIADFGLAKRDAREITMTIEGQLIGTPAYMSPEQARGDAHHADRRSDIYSLGVILFELLTGELPFRGATRMLLLQVTQDEPPSPRKLQSNIPRDLETIVLKCMSKEPSKRYATALDVQRDLNLFLSGDPIHARPPDLIERFVKWTRKNRATAALIASLFCFAVGVSGLTWYAFYQYKRADQATRSEAAERERSQKLANQNLKLAEAERQAADEALAALKAAEASALAARKAEQMAEQEKLNAESAAVAERFAKEEAIEARMAAESARQVEEIAKNEAINLGNIAIRERKLADARWLAALKDYESLATRFYDVQRAELGEDHEDVREIENVLKSIRESLEESEDE